MALGPKELGSWANDPILSTEIRDQRVEKLREGIGKATPNLQPRIGPMGHIGLIGIEAAGGDLQIFAACKT
jgi:hypothetical protein